MRAGQQGCFKRTARLATGQRHPVGFEMRSFASMGRCFADRLCLTLVCGHNEVTALAAVGGLL